MTIPQQMPGLILPTIWRRKEKTEDFNPSDSELMLRLRAKDSYALKLLFERYSHLVLSIAQRILHDYGEAEEIVQDAFLQIYQKAHLYDPMKGAAKAWIGQIATHRALDRKSYLARRNFYFDIDLSCVEHRLPDQSDLDRELTSKFKRAELEKAFEALPRMQRKTLELSYFEGLVLREISVKLDEPLGNVRHHYYRGIEGLRKIVLDRVKK